MILIFFVKLCKNNILCFNRKRKLLMMNAVNTPNNNKLQSIYGRPDDAYQSVKWSAAVASQSRYPSAVHHTTRIDTYESDGNEYAYVDELQLPPSSSAGPQRGYGPPSSACGLLLQRQQCGGCDGNNVQNGFTASGRGEFHQPETFCSNSQYFKLKLDSRAGSLPKDLHSDF